MIRRLLAAFFVVAACAAAVAMAGAGSPENAKGKKYRIAFDNAFGLSDGGDLRVAGVEAGQTKQFNISKGPECQGATPGDGPARTCAIAESVITQPGMKSFREDATCEIKQQSLIGEYYVDCQPGQSAKELPDNAVIPVTKTTSTIPIDLVQNVMRRPYRERFRLIISELGTGLAGRPQDVAELLRRAHPGLRETTKVLRILGDQRETIKDFIQNSNTVVRELDNRKQDIVRFIEEAGETAEISASRAEDIERGFERLPVFLDELRPTMARLGELTEAQTPLLLQLQRAAPSLTEFFTRLGPFAEASRPSFRSLGRASVTGNRAFVESREEIDMLRQLAAKAPETGKPLRQFLQTLDDRSRTTLDPDVRAAQTAPPAPDKNANTRNLGFTGMEALLNYWFWQTLALNEFDRISHFLRVLGVIPGACAEYQNDLRGPERGGTEEQEKLRKRCNTYLGTYQPGITHPDPTEDPAPDGREAASGDGETTGKPQAGDRRFKYAEKGRGSKEQDALPGRPDYSQPNPTIPPEVRELLDGLRQPVSGEQQPGGGAQLPGGASPDQMLDFLLAP